MSKFWVSNTFFIENVYLKFSDYRKWWTVKSDTAKCLGFLAKSCENGSLKNVKLIKHFS